MKKLLLIAVLAIGCVSFLYGQSAGDVYASFASERGAQSISVGGFATWVVKKFNRDMKSVKSLRVLSLAECNGSVREKFNKEAAAMSLDGYTTLVRVKEDSEDVRVLIKVKDDAIRELIVFSMGDDPAMIHVKGKLKTSDIEKYINS